MLLPFSASTLTAALYSPLRWLPSSMDADDDATFLAALNQVEAQLAAGARQPEKRQRVAGEFGAAENVSMPRAAVPARPQQTSPAMQASPAQGAAVPARPQQTSPAGPVHTSPVAFSIWDKVRGPAAASASHSLNPCASIASRWTGTIRPRLRSSCATSPWVRLQRLSAVADPSTQGVWDNEAKTYHYPLKQYAAMVAALREMKYSGDYDDPIVFLAELTSLLRAVLKEPPKPVLELFLGPPKQLAAMEPG